MTRCCAFCGSRMVMHEDDGCQCALCGKANDCPHPKARRVLAEDMGGGMEINCYCGGQAVLRAPLTRTVWKCRCGARIMVTLTAAATAASKSKED